MLLYAVFSKLSTAYQGIQCPVYDNIMESHKLLPLSLTYLYYDVYYIQQMSNRLGLLSQHIKKPKIVDSSFDFLNLPSLLSPQEEDVRKQVRHFVETQIKESIIPYVQNAKFPDYLVPKIQKLGLLKYFFKKPYGHGVNILIQCLIAAELARGDAGVATMCTVQCGLLGYTIQLLGSEEQKAKYLPKIINLEMIGGWGLTEDKIGSDASNLLSSVSKVPDGYKINGVKRWIGNGNKDLLLTWARNTENKKVEAYILQTKNLKGWSAQVIKNKIGLRIVQNCTITLDNVIVPESQKLPHAIDFQNGTNKVLKHSRVFVCWIAAGICMGVYDNVINFATQRKQFGRSISGFQLIQEKLVRIIANVQGILLLCFRITRMMEEGKAELGQIAMAKAWVTERGRQVCRLGREICGGNGLLHENYVMRALTDMEAVYTYEGTYEVNALVAGRELTGLAAFTK